MIAIFVAGYILIALENKMKINKAAVALIMCGVMWAVLMVFGAGADPSLTRSALSADAFEAMASTGEVVIFLICAMTIVSLIDTNGGFDFITRRITTRNKVALVWIIALLTFFLSAVLDNLTTTIVMIMLMRKLLANYKERWVFAALIVIAANAGGAWSPIGDVTTIMLWVRGNITAWGLVSTVFLPSLVSLVIPCLFCARILHGIVTTPGYVDERSDDHPCITGRQSLVLLILGVGLIVSIPVVKALTGLPPWLGMVFALGVMWIVTEVMYDRRPDIPAGDQNRVSRVIREIDMSTILFLLGILMTVSALEGAGILGGFAGFLDRSVHNIYLMDTLIGVMSAVVDNVPLVAASISMYPLPDAAAVASAADPAYTAWFLPDGAFWTLLAYCAGRGGSLLIIGSAAGVVAMGLEKINFTWYLRHFTLMALTGYLAGILTFLAQMLFTGKL